MEPDQGTMIIFQLNILKQLLLNYVYAFITNIFIVFDLEIVYFVVKYSLTLSLLIF